MLARGYVFLSHVKDTDTSGLYRKNAEKWDVMSSAEREEYLAANKDLGNKRYAASWLYRWSTC
jgi:hypothetical protein